MLLGNFTGFPPTLVQAGTRDLFLPIAVPIHRRLRNAEEHADLNHEIRRFFDRHRRTPAAGA